MPCFVPQVAAVDFHNMHTRPLANPAPPPRPLVHSHLGCGWQRGVLSGEASRPRSHPLSRIALSRSTCVFRSKMTKDSDRT